MRSSYCWKFPYEYEIDLFFRISFHSFQFSVFSVQFLDFIFLPFWSSKTSISIPLWYFRESLSPNKINKVFPRASVINRKIERLIERIKWFLKKIYNCVGIFFVRLNCSKPSRPSEPRAKSHLKSICQNRIIEIITMCPY